MLQASPLISILTVLLYLAGVFGFGGATGKDSATVPGLADSGSSQHNAASFVLASGSSVKIGDTVEASGRVVNIRSGPGTSYPILGTVSTGQTATVEGGSNGWLKLRFQDNLTGWVADWLVRPGKGNPAAAHVPAGLQSIGYFVTTSANDTTSLDSMAQAGKSLTGIAPFSFTVDGRGYISGKNNSEAVSRAKKAGQVALALVHNTSGDWFSSTVAHNLLSQQVNRTRAINEILYIIKTYGYDGVNIDFESVKPSDRENFNTFIRELSWALRPKGYLVTVSVPAKTKDDKSHNWSGAYDYKVIGEYADWVMLMAYDQHYKTGSPGPVAAINWVEQVVKYAVSTIPKHKIILGVPAYGYDWPTNGSAARSVSYAQAMNIAKTHGITPKWHATYKVPYFSYVSNGVVRQVWFESSWSLEHKLKLVKEYGLKGIAIWRLGLEDPRSWDVIKEYFY
ncbi:MAG: SH3 domain-containing protein [Firmicutes bacterium]|nr:SH3 domain-containing protein [Bacillota bacterium]